MTVYINHNRNTCIAYSTTGEEDNRMVHFVRNVSPELALELLDYKAFHKVWRELIGYDRIEAARKYLSGYIPFSNEVKTILERIMNTAANEANAGDAAAPIVTPAAKPIETKATAKKAKAPAKKAAAKKAEVKVVKGAGKSGDVTVTKVPKEAKDKKAAAKAEAFFADQESKKKAKDKAAPAPKAGKKAAAAPKEKKAAADISGMTIKLLKGHEDKRFQEGSMRQACFKKIKDNMSVKSYLTAVAKLNICTEAQAIDCLKKLADTNQKQQVVKLS